MALGRVTFMKIRNLLHLTNTIQTSEEISFFDSHKDSILYSIARFFYQTAILCCHKFPVADSLQGTK